MTARQGITLVTCEYPPQVGGVAAYTRQVAVALAARGVQVEVLAPGTPDGQPDAAITVSRVLGSVGRVDLRRADAVLDGRIRPNRLVVQWVPHGYGWRSMNVPFARWVARRAVRGDVVDVMIHEPRLRFMPYLHRQNVAVPVHFLMLRVVLRHATRVWMSTDAWLEYVAPHVGRGVTPVCLPVPSPIEPRRSPAELRAAIRRRFAPGGGPLVGHFSAFGPIAWRELLHVLPGVAHANPQASFVLIGSGSDVCLRSLVREDTELEGRVQATGTLDDTALSAHLDACDVMIQPYEDGVTTRRTSVTAALAHGIPIVTSDGPLTEPFWRTTKAVVLSARDAVQFGAAVRQVLADRAVRETISRTARDVYDARFHVRHTVAALLAD